MIGITPVFTGCQSGTPPLPDVSIQQSAAGSVATVTADWDDIEASTIVGSAAIEAVISSDAAEGPRRHVFELRLIGGEPGRLVCERATAPKDEAHPAPVPITLTARVGRFGNEALETTLLRATAHRLERLRGVDFAPLD